MSKLITRIQFEFSRTENTCNIYSDGQRIAYTVMNKKGGYDYIGLFGHIFADCKATNALAAAKALFFELYCINK